MQGRRLVQVSVECVCTCPYLLAVPLRALNFMDSCLAMRPGLPAPESSTKMDVPFSKIVARP